MMDPKRRKIVFLVFGAAVLAGFTLFFIPAFIIRPFRTQYPASLTVAMAVAQHAPLWTAIALLLALATAIWAWRSAALWQKLVLVTGLLLVGASAAMARTDYFEWMFHPIRSVGFQTLAQSKLKDGEMVMAVHFASDARAYPIREMAYHHILNDTVGGTPIAVTY